MDQKIFSKRNITEDNKVEGRSFMKFMRHILNVMFFRTGPRITRGEYFLALISWTFLITVFFWLLTMMLLYRLNYQALDSVLLVTTIIETLVHTVVFVILTFKRLQDLNWSKRKILGLIVPFWNIYIFVMLFLSKGSISENKYGKESSILNKKNSNAYYIFFGISILILSSFSYSFKKADINNTYTSLVKRENSTSNTYNKKSSNSINMNKTTDQSYEERSEEATLVAFYEGVCEAFPADEDFRGKSCIEFQAENPGKWRGVLITIPRIQNAATGYPKVRLSYAIGYCYGLYENYELNFNRNMLDFESSYDRCKLESLNGNQLKMIERKVNDILVRYDLTH